MIAIGGFPFLTRSLEPFLQIRVEAGSISYCIIVQEANPSVILGALHWYMAGLPAHNAYFPRNDELFDVSGRWFPCLLLSHMHLILTWRIRIRCLMSVGC